MHQRELCFNSRLVPRTPPEEGGCHLVHWFRKWRRLPVSLNLPLCHPRDGLLFPLRRIRVSLRSRPRRARALWDATALLPMPSFLPLFVLITIVAQGTTTCASSRTSWQAEHCFVASSFAICHSIVFTIFINAHGSSYSRVSQCLQCSAVGYRKAMPPCRRRHTERHQAGHERRQRM